jgi:peroxiredoxin
MPELEKLYPQFKANRVQLIGLSIDTEGIGAVKECLSKHNYTYPMVNVGETGIEQIFATDEATVPLSVLLDEKGRVIRVFGGWSQQTAEELKHLAGFSQASDR